MTFSVGLVIKTMSSSTTSFTCSGQLTGFCLSQADPFSHSLSSNCDGMTPLVPMSAGFIMPFTCRHSSTADWSSISRTLLATNTCCFSRVECNHWRTVIESVQCVTVWIWISWPSVISCLSLTEYSAACNANFGIVCCFIGATLHSAITNDKFTPTSSSART